MTQHGIILTNDSQMGNNFTTILNSSLPFDNLADEEWRISLGELLYYPYQWPTIRDKHNTIEIELSDYYLKSFVSREFYFTKWDVTNKIGPQHFIYEAPSEIADSLIAQSRYQACPGKTSDFSISQIN